MKRIVLLGFIFINFLVLNACSTSAEQRTEVKQTKITSTTEHISQKRKLENLGLSNSQAENFDSFCKTIDNVTHDIETLNTKIINREDVGLEDKGIILEDVQNIEEAYLNNGGQKQNNVINTLQSNFVGFYQIASNMIQYNREYTDTEAYGSLSVIVSIVEELADDYNLEYHQKEELIQYFFNNIDPSGKYINAVNNLL